MRRITQLFRPLAAAMTVGGAAPFCTPPASGFLTIGSTTYVDPAGSYPIDRSPDGAAILVINDTDRHIAIVTESDHGIDISIDVTTDVTTDISTDVTGDSTTDITADIVLAPGARTETRRGQTVQVGWGRVMGVERGG
ncbi:hypothetical protein AB0I10_05635 [Streptomyces sp. NPDC050636]|uniref:hypothetical protein n=1 Tax=Streptomyces sp. NPDC050636 TaxID=3154510 RepID=UPI003419768E